MPALQVIALDTTTPQLRAPASGDTYSAPRALDITPETLTGSSATSSLSIAQTWNTSGTPTAIDLNVTDTASNAASLLMNLRVGGSSRFSLRKDGFIITTGSMTVGGNINLPGTANNLNWGGNIVLVGDAANTLALRNGVNAQAFRVYNTFTDASNYERFSMGWAGNVFSLGAEAAGTGTGREVRYSNLFVQSGNWRLNAGGTNISSFFSLGGNIVTNTNAYFGFSDNYNNADNPGQHDVRLWRDAAATLAQRNGTNAQAFRVYNTFTDASNYERGYASWVSNTFRIGAEAAGTGTVRPVDIYGGASQLARFTSTDIIFYSRTSFNNNTISGGSATVNARTSDGTEQSSMVYVTNRGATGTVTRTLQTYITPITFRRIATQAFRIEPSAGHRFRRLNGTLEAVDKYLELGSDGATITVVWDGTEYQVIAEAGTINVEP